MEVFYWPLVDLFVWGFITVYLSAYKGALPDFVGFFLGALILWDMLFRCQQGITVSFLEDMWSRNLLNIFVSPLSPAEYVCSLLVMSVIKLLLASSVMILVAWGLYSFNVFQMGFALAPLAANLLMMGWAVGIITTAVIMRFGQETEVLAWGIAFLFPAVLGRVLSGERIAAGHAKNRLLHTLLARFRRHEGCLSRQTLPHD